MFYDAGKNNHGLAVNPFKALVAPRPIAWISSVSRSGVRNLAPYSFFNAVSEDPPYVVVGAGVGKDSQRNLEETGEFAVNFVTHDLREAMNASSAAVGPEIDEFVLAGVTAASCTMVSAPRVAESPVTFECRHYKTEVLPDEQGRVESHLIIARVVGIHIADEFLRDGRVDTAGMGLIARLGYSEYATVREAWRMRRPG